MAFLRNKPLVLILCALIGVVACQVSQGGPGQGGTRQAPQTADDEQASNDPPTWVPCDITASPRVTCADCNNRLICKPIGGLLVQCQNPFRPYCNNGICTSVPAAGC